MSSVSASNEILVLYYSRNGATAALASRFRVEDLQTAATLLRGGHRHLAIGLERSFHPFDRFPVAHRAPNAREPAKPSGVAALLRHVHRLVVVLALLVMVYLSYGYEDECDYE